MEEKVRKTLWIGLKVPDKQEPTQDKHTLIAIPPEITYFDCHSHFDRLHMGHTHLYPSSSSSLLKFDEQKNNIEAHHLFTCSSIGFFLNMHLQKLSWSAHQKVAHRKKYVRFNKYVF